MINHPTFFREFLNINRSRLIDHYTICTRFLRRHGLPYIPSNAGFFVWVDLSAYLSSMKGDTDLEKERYMNNKLLDGGVHLATSEAFRGEYNGWFRITFTVEKEMLILALNR